MKYDVKKRCKITRFFGVLWKNNIQEAYLAKISIPGKISFGILAHLCSDDSIQILLNSTQFITLRTKSKLEGFVWSHQSKTGLVSQDNLPHNVFGK